MAKDSDIPTFGAQKLHKIQILIGEEYLDQLAKVVGELYVYFLLCLVASQPHLLLD